MSYPEVMSRIESAARGCGRTAEEITLVAVSKAKDPKDVMAIYEQGHRHFGENRAREMARKAEHLPDDIRWHFVGALQSNKTTLVRERTHLLHSMDRRSLATAWLKGPGPPPPVLLQVNVGGEAQKSGIEPEEAGETVEWMRGMGLEVRGLMTLPPAPDRPEDSRPYFRAIRELRDRLRADHPDLEDLSMGMTDDFEVAIEEGASIIRVGRAIFGPRT
ncbi:MAG: YggS family pyridoxal phosphate-dependent enzyme [Acidimicrobiia bacterium]